MKKKLNKIIIPVPIYRVSVVIFFGETLEEIIKQGIKGNIKKENFTKKWQTWVRDNMETALGICCNYGEDNSDVLVWVKTQPKKCSEYAILYHELYHATDHIADSRAFNIEDKISEPKAFLFEYLFTYVSKILWI